MLGIEVTNVNRTQHYLLGIYILNQELLSMVGKLYIEALGAHVRKYFVLPIDLRKHSHEMMFELIWG